jgi:hypothetical protein
VVLAAQTVLLQRPDDHVIVATTNVGHLSLFVDVYTVRFAEAVYVLHAFQKKSPSGIRTAKRDVELVAQRLKVAQQGNEEHYGKPKR